jgi:hypothetical protein
MEQEKAAAKGPTKKKGCWPWSKEVIDVPLFDDVNCPYAIKPSELFKINEVGCSSILHSALLALYACNTDALTLLQLFRCI